MKPETTPLLLRSGLRHAPCAAAAIEAVVAVCSILTE